MYTLFAIPGGEMELGVKSYLTDKDARTGKDSIEQIRDRSIKILRAIVSTIDIDKVEVETQRDMSLRATEVFVVCPYRCLNCNESDKTSSRKKELCKDCYEHIFLLKL